MNTAAAEQGVSPTHSVVNDANRHPHVTDLVAIAMASASGIAIQIALTRLFSITLWHHFAYLVVGVALLGAGLAGAHLTSRGGALLERDGTAHQTLAFRAAFASIATLLSVMTICVIRCNALELFRDPSVWFSLALLVLVCTVPFYGIGLVVGTSLAAFRSHPGRVYAADLIGAGVAGALCTVGLSTVGALGLLAACAMALGLASILFAIRSSRRSILAALAALSCALIGSFVLRDEDSWLTIAPAKELSWAHKPELGQRFVAYRAWTPLSRIDVTFPGQGPVGVAGEVGSGFSTWNGRVITQDGAAPTMLFHFDHDPAELAFLPHSTTSAVWVERGAQFQEREAPDPDGARVLVIGAGGGIDLAAALAYGARQVTGAEINPETVKILSERFSSEVGNLTHRKGVKLVQSEGRAYLRASHDRYDVIQLSGVDTFTALASGAYSLAEAYVYTREAFVDFYDHLSDGGCLSVSRLMLEPPRETLRLAVTARDAWQSRGVADPSKNIAIIQAKVWGTLLACRSPIPASAVARLHEFVDREGFRFTYDPIVDNHNLYSHTLRISPEERAKLLARYPYQVEPATDEAPFFFNYYRWSSLKYLFRATEGGVYGSIAPIGHGILFLTFVLTSLVAVFGILRPVRRVHQSGYRIIWPYFAGLGFGYLFVESALLQRLTLVLGHPTYSLSVVLSALLTASGVGAALSHALSRSRLGKWLGATICAVALIAAVVSWKLLPAAVALGFSGRVGVSLALIVPLGLVLGMPFPIGLSRVSAQTPALVPWAFAVNSFATVVAASVAPMVAMELGFSSLFVLAALAYALAFWSLRRKSGETSPAQSQHPASSAPNS